MVIGPEVRAAFPILKRTVTVRGQERPIIFLDHGASTHAPQPVIDAVNELQTNHYANVHRGNHRLSMETSEMFDDALATMARFAGANPETQPAILAGNTTQALDLAAHLMDGPGATLTTLMEHHSNDLPHRRRGEVIHAAVDGEGRVMLDSVEDLLQKHDVKLLAVAGASNVTGYMPPIHKLARLAHDAGARILVDAAQLWAHAPIDVLSPDHPEHLDLVAAAGHKAYAPYGSAVLLAPHELMEPAPPYLPGGGTVTWVTDSDVGFLTGPEKHQGGTPNVAGAIAFGAACRWLQGIGLDAVREHELELLRYGMPLFDELDVAVLGPTDPREKAAVFTFIAPGIGHEDVSRLLDARYGIATRNGCFCAQPMMTRLLQITERKWIEALERRGQVELPGATRATFGIYNNREEMDALVGAIRGLAVETPA